MINTWSKRNLTVIGKISVVKTLILPILNHLFLTLPNPNAEMIKKINDAIYYFLWNSPVHRVKKEVLHMDYKNGGLKMINIHLFMIALKCTWIRKLFSSNCKWLNILFTNIDKEKLFKLGNSYTTNTISNVKNKFWIDVFKAWQYFVDKDINSTWEYFLASPLWMNKNININNKHVLHRSWYNEGIFFVNDVISNSGKFLSYGEIKDKFDISGNIMMYNSIISALNKTKKLYSRGDNKLTEPFIPSFVQTILKRKKGTKDIYWMLIPKVVPNGEKKWNQILELNELEWREIFKLPFAVTNNTKLQWLQFRVNHRILATNKFLCKINVINSQLCNFCKEEIETIEHVLWNCENVQNLLEEIDIWFVSNGISISFTKKKNLFGDVSHVYKGEISNLIFLCLKQYIYNTRYFQKVLSIHAVKKILKDLYNLEKSSV